MWTRAPPAPRAYSPGPENREVYDELYEVYKDLYPATSPMAHTLAHMQTGEET